MKVGYPHITLGHFNKKITKTLFLQIFGHVAFIKQKFRWHSTLGATVSSIFLLDKGRVAENLQKECLCYFINVSSTSVWRNHFNHIHFHKILKEQTRYAKLRQSSMSWNRVKTQQLFICVFTKRFGMRSIICNAFVLSPIIYILIRLLCNINTHK